MKLTGTLLKSSVIAALIAAPLAPAFAQSADPSTEAPAPQAEVPAADFSEEQLTSFVDAAMEVQTLQQDYSQRIAAEENPEEKQALVSEAQTEMATAVDETEGMDINTYNAIGNAARQNPELNDRIMAMVQTRSPSQNKTMVE